MARSKKRDDLESVKAPAPQAPVDVGRQPRILGWLVLIAGASSTWYWYRPLPRTINATTNVSLPLDIPTNPLGPKSLWTDQGLVVPSLNMAAEPISIPSSELLSNLEQDSKLMGPPKAVLMPWNEWNESRPSISEVLKSERIPMVPVEPTPKKTPTAEGPKSWVPDQESKSHKLISEDPKNWPDIGYTPPVNPIKEKQRASTKITTNIPPLLETGMRTIRVSEDNDGKSTSQANAQPLDPSVATAPSDQRQPSFIRQPNKK